MNFLDTLTDNIKQIFVSSAKPVQNTTVPEKPKKTPKASTAIWKAADAYKYEDDILRPAKYQSKAVFDKWAMCIHFSWTKSLESLSYYFEKQIDRPANSTWGVGKDGTCHRYLPDARQPAWTQGVGWNEKNAGFITPEGKKIKNINDYALSFEIDNINYEPYTEKQYEAVAIRTIWQLKNFPNYRLWLTTGHEHVAPFQRHDPGPQWNWKHYLVDLCGMSKDFYDEYMTYLQEHGAYTTVGNESYSAKKFAAIEVATNKIASELTGQDKEYCF